VRDTKTFVLLVLIQFYHNIVTRRSKGMDCKLYGVRSVRRTLSTRAVHSPRVVCMGLNEEIIHRCRFLCTL